jgi:hypothetical protein
MRSSRCNLSRLSLICCRPYSRRWNSNRQITTSPGHCSNDSKCARSFNLPPVYCWRYALTALDLGVVLGELMIWFDPDGWLRVEFSLSSPFPPFTEPLTCVVDKTRLWWQQHPKLKLVKESPSVLLGEERVCCYCGHSDHLPSRGTRPCVCGCCLDFFLNKCLLLSIFIDICRYFCSSCMKYRYLLMKYRYFMILSINNYISPVLSIFIANSFLVYRYLSSNLMTINIDKFYRYFRNIDINYR